MSTTIQQETDLGTIDWDDLTPKCSFTNVDGCTVTAAWIVTKSCCRQTTEFCCRGHIDRKFFCQDCGKPDIFVEKRPL